MTRDEKIRAMSVEELAGVLFEFRFDGYALALGDVPALPNSQAAIVKWLKEDA